MAKRPLQHLTEDELRARIRANVAAGLPPGPCWVEFARRLSPQQVFEGSVRAGIHNPDGTLTEWYRGGEDDEEPRSQLSPSIASRE